MKMRKSKIKTRGVTTSLWKNEPKDRKPLRVTGGQAFDAKVTFG